MPGLKRIAASMPDVPLRRARRTPALPPNTLRPLDRFGPDADALWARFREGIGVGVDRTATYLNWRFVDKPDEAYTRTGYYDGDRLVGFVVHAVKEKHGGRVGYVMELLHAPDRPDVGRVLMSTALDAMVAARADVALGWSFAHSPNAAAYRSGGFVGLPERLRPIELHFGVRALDASLEAVVYDAARWYLSYADSDTV